MAWQYSLNLLKSLFDAFNIPGLYGRLHSLVLVWYGPNFFGDYPAEPHIRDNAPSSSVELWKEALVGYF